MEAAQQAGGGGLAGAFERVRATTAEIVRNLRPDDYAVQTAPYTSPPKWHLGHASWMYEVVMGRITGSGPPSGEMHGYLNSYYRGLGDPRDKGSRGSVSRPSLSEVLEYSRGVDARFAGMLRGGGLGPEEERLVETALHHECQHQELMAYDLQHMLADRYEPARAEPPPGPAPAEGRSIPVRGGLYELGHGGGGFCYDVEEPEHTVYLQDYEIDELPVTCGQYARFVDEGGYSDHSLWLSDGWDRVRGLGWEAPMYWERRGGAWRVRDFRGDREVDPAEPVCHVSFYEAAAYCRWAGRRLPTEAEWERAALLGGDGRKRAFPWGDAPPGPGLANLLDSRVWGRSRAGAYPAGASPCGCRQMVGDVWEWTSSEFDAYPGFRSRFDEYNDKWFTGQKVLRGGSFATPALSVRGSYRNFFRLDERWMFAGFRCAG